MNEINLLPKQNQGSVKEEQAVSLIRKIAVVVLAAVAFTAIVLFILTIQSPLPKVKEQEDALLAKLSLSANLVSRNAIIQERLSSITGVLKERNIYDTYMSSILEQLPPNVTVGALSVKKKTIQLSGNSASLDATNIFLDNLITLKNQKKVFSSVVLRNFLLQGDSGKYFFTVEITLL